MPLELQVKLLRLIQNGEIEKVGATGTTNVDVRIIAATHRNLQAMIEDGTFREDLYYRLAVVPLELPPLRERAEDIPELVQHLFLKARQKHDLPQPEAAIGPDSVFHRIPLAGQREGVGERRGAAGGAGGGRRDRIQRPAGFPAAPEGRRRTPSSSNCLPTASVWKASRRN